MALTPAERQRNRRKRLKTAHKTAPDVSHAYVRGSFSKYVEANDDADQSLSFIAETLDSVGLNQKVPLTKDTDPECDEHPEWAAFGVINRGALGRAERMVDALIDCAKSLAETINRYKLQEIEAAIRKLETSKLSTHAAQKKALSDIVRLKAIHARLKREVRHSFATSTVKGEPNG